jgi:hypothetical protein
VNRVSHRACNSIIYSSLAQKQTFKAPHAFHRSRLAAYDPHQAQKKNQAARGGKMSWTSTQQLTSLTACKSILVLPTTAAQNEFKINKEQT